MPSLSNWVAPTLNVEELDKRIQELRAVQFWLDQNAKALAATIQALEVQKMTLATLKGMNLSMNELAESLKLKPQAAAAAPAPAAAAPAPAPEPQSAPKAKPKAKAKEAEADAGVIDPLQWWGSLTQQFQHIAANAMQDAAKNAAAGSEAVAQAAGVKKPAAAKPKAKARKTPARKTAARD